MIQILQRQREQPKIIGMTADRIQIENPLFIANQRLFRLNLNAREAETKLDYLKLERLPDHGLNVPQESEQAEREIEERYRSRWQSITGNRARNLGLISGQRQLLCITAAGGNGKSIALDQLVDIRPAIMPGHLVIRVHFSELPSAWEQYLENPQPTTVPSESPQHHDSPGQVDLPFLTGKILKRIHNLPRDRQSSLQRLTDNPNVATEWLKSIIRAGQLTLAVDGLDEAASTDRIKAVEQLRTILRQHPRLHCVVAGRPNAITNKYWKGLFATHPGRDNDRSSEWEFWLAGMFDNDQIRLSLGDHRTNQLSQLQGNLEFNPRTLDVLRTLHTDIFKTLRSGADAYWHSIYQSLDLDREKKGQQPLTELGIDEILDILSAMAITMLMWECDPTAPARESLDPASQRTTESTAPVAAKPTRQISGNADRQTFYAMVHRRLAKIYPNWKDNEFQTAKKKIQQLLDLNTNFIEISYLVNRPDLIQWRNVTQRDFFAALWMVRSSGDDERNWFLQRQSSVLTWSEEYSRHVEIADTWRFICGMPDDAFVARESQKIPKSDRWLACIAALFQQPKGSSRSTELMYLAWPNLLRRAGILNYADWSEDDLDRASSSAVELLLTNHKPLNDIPWPKRIVFQFLNEYQQLKNGERGDLSRVIIEEDLEGHLHDCKSYAGKQVRVGHERDADDNAPRWYVLPRGFSMCEYLVTRRLYGLFDRSHEQRFKEFTTYSPQLRCPVIYTTWYDSMMFCYWSGCLLANEWEWEYSCCGVDPDESDEHPIYFWGDEFEERTLHGWFGDNSSGVTREVGHLPAGASYAAASASNPNTYNGFGLSDMSGNVWEWCRNCYGSESVSRSVRGSSFANFYASGARCSCRGYGVPAGASHDGGFRVSRARKS